MFRGFAAELRLVQYDPRGFGLSEAAADLSLDALVSDTRAVLAAVGGGPAAIVTPVTAAPLGIAFAAAHPDQVSALALLGPEIDPDRRASIVRALKRADAELGRTRSVINPTMPAEDVEPSRALANATLQRWEREGVRERMQQALLDWQVNDLLPRVACPTLVVHYPERATSDGAYVAGRIPGARLVNRAGPNAPPFNPDIAGLAKLVNEFVIQHAFTPHQPDAPAFDAPQGSLESPR
ncbi:MAG: Pimeloyl-ACP methyl ester carboxylesterase [Chloroflexi bacterium]|nr:MAG: Pimeloyl-ACP methyl ester carboxylesterase [Chloroflexota bacterium]